jgi:hypothetical protein
MDSNEEEGVCYPQPVTLEDRVAIAGDFVERCGYEIPIAIDPPDNPADAAYAAWPERFYIVDESGTIAYKGKTGPFGYHPEEVAAWLMQRFPPAVIPPIEVSAESLARDPLSVRAVEHVDERERWRLELDPAAPATVDLRKALGDEAFFGWAEASGEPVVEGRVRILAIQLGDKLKIVHRYSLPQEDGPPDPDDGFERIWRRLRGLDP